MIDPVKLMRLYDYFKGYQPSVGSVPGSAIDDEIEERGEGALDPSVPAVSRAPLPSTATYVVSSEVAQLHAAVAKAVESFLRGERLREDEAIEMSTTVQFCSEDGGGVVVRPATDKNPDATGGVYLFEQIKRVGDQLGADLSWFERSLPVALGDTVLRYCLQKLEATRVLRLRTESDVMAAEMNGSLAAQMQVPVAHAASPATDPTNAPALNSSTRDLSVLCRAVGHADGPFVQAEIEVTTRVLVDLTAAIDNATLSETILLGRRSLDECKSAATALAAKGDQSLKRKVLKGLWDVALADRMLHPDEATVLREIAGGFSMSEYVEALIDLSAPR